MATVDLKSISHLLNAAGVTSEAASEGTGQFTSRQSKETEHWSRILSQLQEWQAAPEYQDEDGYVYPSELAISVASEIVNAMRSESFRAPTWVVMTGDGGINIDMENGPQKTEIEIDESGEQEVRVYSNDRIVERTQMTLVDLTR